MERLGPRWDPEATDRFYKAFSKFGKEWALVATRVPGRSPAMVKAMYRANRTYLSLSDAERSGQGFQALVHDMYCRPGAIDTSSDEGGPSASPSQHGTRSGSKSRKGSVRRAAGSSKRAKVKESPMMSDEEELSAKHRKRKRELFPESPHENVPVGKRKRKTHTTAMEKGRGESTGLDTLLAVMESPGPEVAIKLKTKFKGKEEPSAPKPQTSAALAWLQSLPSESLSDESKAALGRLHHCLSTKRARRWCLYEWFYSGIDQLYFQQNEFQLLLNDIGIPHVDKLSRTEWAYIRGRLGKPRRLSQRYLEEERRKLQDYRQEVRNQHAGRPASTCNSTLDFYLDEIPAPINVGHRVMARHPKTGELYLGNILLKDDHVYRVQFDDAQLGVVKIQDTYVMPHPIGPIAKWTRPAPQPSTTWPNTVLVEQLHSMLAAFGVRFSPDRPVEVPSTLSEAYRAIVLPAAASLEQHHALCRELESLPDSAKEASLPEIQHAEAAMAAALEQLEACSGGMLEPQMLSPELLAEQCLAAAHRLVEQLWDQAAATNPSMNPSAGEAGVVAQQMRGGQGSIVVRQRHSTADAQRLQELLACSVAMVIAMHDSAKYSESDISDTLENLAARMAPLGKLTVRDHEEMLHSLSSFCEASRLLAR